MQIGIWSSVCAAAAVATLAACTLGPPASGVQAASPAVSARAAGASPGGERETYVARAMADPRPQGLEGRRQVSSGSGFYFAADKLMTNFHVAGACAVVTVGNDSEGEMRVARVIAGDSALDLAVIASDVTVADPARFETRLSTESGEGLAIIGYPEHGLVVRQAELDRVSTHPADLLAERRVYRFDGPVRHGNSGGPVLDETGAVLGITAMKIDTVAVYQHTGAVVDNVGFAIGNHTVFGFLAANKLAYLPAVPAASLTPAQLLEKAHGFVRQIGCWK